MYLTPARYLSMGWGMDLSDVDDQDLASHIAVASALVNTHCNVPADYDFRGGTATDEAHPWAMGNYMWPGSGRIFPDHAPLLSLTSFDIYVTSSQYLNIASDRVHYHPASNALEPVVAASSIGVWSYSAYPVAGFRIPEARITYTYGYRFNVTRERMSPDGGIRWRASNQWWDEDVTPVIEVNGIELDPGDIDIDYDEGTVDIDDDALTALDISVSEVETVKATYTHKLPANIMNATAFITTSLLGQRSIAAKGLLGLSGIKVEEVEIRQSRDSQAARDMIPGNAEILLVPYRRFHWG